jgi:hypothetical protein
VLSADVLVVELLRLLVGKLHDLAGAIGKSFVHGSAHRPPGKCVANDLIITWRLACQTTRPAPLSNRDCVRLGGEFFTVRGCFLSFGWRGIAC